MKHRTGLILILMVITLSNVVGQTLADFKYSSCEDNNPLKYRINTSVNKVRFSNDSAFIKIIWFDNCAFEPAFSLTTIKNDTIYFKYVNKAADEAVCGCVFELEFVLKGMEERNYQIKVNDWKIEKNAKRYKTEGYIVEYFPEVSRKKKLREIYFENGDLVAEVYYDREGNITHEKFYEWGRLRRENKY